MQTFAHTPVGTNNGMTAPIMMMPMPQQPHHQQAPVMVPVGQPMQPISAFPQQPGSVLHSCSQPHNQQAPHTPSHSVPSNSTSASTPTSPSLGEVSMTSQTQALMIPPPPFPKTKDVLGLGGDEEGSTASDTEGEEDDNGPKQLIINFLSHETTEDDLTKAFSTVGPVECSRVVSDRHTGTSKGYGFVYYESSSDAEKAITSMQGTALNGRHIKVGFAIPQRPSPKQAERQAKMLSKPRKNGATFLGAGVPMPPGVPSVLPPPPPSMKPSATVFPQQQPMVPMIPIDNTFQHQQPVMMMMMVPVMGATDPRSPATPSTTPQRGSGFGAIGDSRHNNTTGTAIPAEVPLF